MFGLIVKRRSIAGLIGGILETQEMLDFFAERGLVWGIEMIRAEKIDTASDACRRATCATAS